jgi:hypothetical protein
MVVRGIRGQELSEIIAQLISKKQKKQSRYTPWRRLGGEEI